MKALRSSLGRACDHECKRDHQGEPHEHAPHGTWAINPYSATDFVRRFLHAVPTNKLFAYGGDTGWPTASVAYAAQARRGLARALEAEVAAGDLTERQAIAVAHRLMRDNQYACFDIEGTRAAVYRAAS